VLDACLIKNRVLNLSYKIIVQWKEKATLIVMHDITFSDHTRVSMWKFMNSSIENVWYGI